LRRSRGVLRGRLLAHESGSVSEIPDDLLDALHNDRRGDTERQCLRDDGDRNIGDLRHAPEPVFNLASTARAIHSLYFQTKRFGHFSLYRIVICGKLRSLATRGSRAVSLGIVALNARRFSLA
jgi:hypothetical protein